MGPLTKQRNLRLRRGLRVMFSRLFGGGCWSGWWGFDYVVKHFGPYRNIMNNKANFSLVRRVAILLW